MKTCRIVVIAFAVLLSACAPFEVRDQAGSPISRPDETRDAVPRNEPLSARGNPPYYEQFGKRYQVMQTAAGYSERGVASWYGKKFHGRTTSNGEIYDMYAMTAAHKTLPLPAYVEVRNLRNGKTVVVRVNDRGPFVDNRIIDLSYAAAAKLGIVTDGTGLVEIRTIGAQRPPSRVVSAPSLHGNIFVQVGAFADPVNARRLRNRIQGQGIKPVIIAQEAINDTTTIHRVRVGPVIDVAAFDKTVAQLRGIGIHDAVLAFE